MSSRVIGRGARSTLYSTHLYLPSIVVMSYTTFRCYVSRGYSLGLVGHLALPSFKQRFDARMVDRPRSTAMCIRSEVDLDELSERSRTSFIEPSPGKLVDAMW